MTRLFAIRAASVALASLLFPALALPAAAQPKPLVTAQPDPGAAVRPYFIDPTNDPVLPYAKMAALLRQKVKYVFVIFNENESFDHEYGTFPGVNGLYSDGRHSRSPAATPGFTQTYTDIIGDKVTVRPFRIGPEENATFADSTDHSHKGLAEKLDVVGGVPKMDGFAKDEYWRYARLGNLESLAEGTQFARLVMAHIDCDTIPFFWRYASRFVIFDNIFATEDTPSAPNAIAMIAGQSGETQWVEHGAGGARGPISGTVNGTTFSGTGTTHGLPLVTDAEPWWGSEFDTTVAHREPTSPKEYYGATGASYNVAPNLTFATVPLTLAGRSVTATMAKDLEPASDLPDIRRDIPYIQSRDGMPVAWRWYQNGYDAEPNDSLDLGKKHQDYVAHHDGPQYFGYIADNPAERANLRGENDFFTDVAENKLPAGGGVFYIRGGFYNIKGEKPPIQNRDYPNPNGLTAADIAAIDAAKSGDDDHPGYSDHQLTEAMNARVINAVAGNPKLWKKSAIIITYDESDGQYDHVPPRILSYGPDGLPLARGIRIPLIVISPFARTHVVSHAEGDHNAVIETLDAIFDLPPLSSLPDEAKALAAGNSPAFNRFAPAGFKQKYLGPRDTNSPITDSLLSAFSPRRLRGEAPPLPASLALIPKATVDSFPHYGGKGCKAIGITPTDWRGNAPPKNVPPHFNTLPSTLPAYN